MEVHRFGKVIARTSWIIGKRVMGRPGCQGLGQGPIASENQETVIYGEVFENGYHLMFFIVWSLGQINPGV